MTKPTRAVRRAILVLVLGLWLPAVARAESVLFLSSDRRAAELSEALELALRGYGPVVASHSAAEGERADARLAGARRLGSAAGADVVVWVEHAPPERVRASAAAEPERLFDAPLPEPLASIDPRVFGSIAASLVLQARRPALAAARDEREVSAERPAAPARRSPRFFLRPAFALGAAYVGKGVHTTDRPPPVERVTQAQEFLEDGRAYSYLFDSGYDCQVSSELPLVASDCKVAVKSDGFAYAPVFDLSAGYLVWRELGIALTLRYSPRAGEGTLASVLFGTEVSWTLLAVPERGFYADVGGGFGFGQIQVRPGNGSAHDGPFVSSGLFNVRGRALLGYMFFRRLGLFAGLAVHAMMPNPLWVLEPKMGLEVRL